MKIVHEIYGKVQAGGSVDQYIPRQGEEPSGGRCELILAVPGEVLRTAAGDEAVGDDEVIHIEGDVDDVIDMLLSALRVLEAAIGDGFVFQREHEGFPTQQEGLR